MVESGNKVLKQIRKFFKYAVLTVVSVITFFPFIWMVFSALKTKDEIMDVDSFFSSSMQWENFTEIIFDSPIPSYISTVCGYHL